MLTYGICTRQWSRPSPCSSATPRCRQQLWAWNRFAPRLIGLHPDDPATARFLGVSTVDLIFNSAFEARLLVANPEEYFPRQIHNIKVGIEPLREQPGYRELVAQWSSFPGFTELWNQMPGDMYRSVVPTGERIVHKHGERL